MFKMRKAVCCLVVLIYQSSVVIAREYHPSAGLPPMPVKDKPMPQIKPVIRDMSDVINDMKDAFSIVCTVDQFKTIAPKMFNMTNPNPTYSFKIFEKTMRKLTYKRDDFERPNFPNLTRAYIHLTRMVRSNSSLAEKEEKILFSNSNTMETEESVHIPSFVRNEKIEPIRQNSTSNDWNILGLPGWEGKITSNFALDFIERKVDSPAMTSSAPHQTEPSKFKIFGTNFPSSIKAITEKGRQPSRYYEAMIRNSSRFRSKPSADALQTSTDAGIYIARANDPFGKSTKWHLRNSSNSVYDREKRSAPELYSMVQCATKCDPLLFKGYGCYCGFLGSGKPTDGVDYCCYLHDKCYERSSCPSFLEYFVPYLWKCYRGRPLCALDHGEWGGPGSCATKLCQCDLLLSKCLRKYGCPKKRNICKTSAVRILQTFLMFA